MDGALVYMHEYLRWSGVKAMEWMLLVYTSVHESQLEYNTND